MIAIRANNASEHSIPYKGLFLLTLFTSAITVNIRGMHMAVGDILLVFLNMILLLSLRSNIVLESNRKKWVQRVLIIFSIIIFFSYISLQNYIFTSYSINRGIIELIKLTVAINYGVVFSLFFAYAGKQDIQDFIRTVILSGLLVALTGLLGYFLYEIGIDTKFVMNGQRARGTLSDTNIMAIYILTILPLLFMYYHKFKAYIIFVIFVVAVLAAGSKAAIVVSVFLVTVFLIMLCLTKKVNKFFTYLITISIILFIFYFTLRNMALFTLLGERLADLSSEDPSVVTTGRTDLWIIGLSVLGDPKNLFLGIGYGGYINLLANVELPYYLSGIELIHNTYLSMLVETGIVSFLVMVFLSIYLVIKTFFISLKSNEIKWVLVMISQLSLIIGMNQVNLQNNRYVYFLIIFYFFLIFNHTDEIKKENVVNFENDKYS